MNDELMQYWGLNNKFKKKSPPHPHLYFEITGNKTSQYQTRKLHDIKGKVAIVCQSAPQHLEPCIIQNR